jgi:glycerol uptake facilitator-like aquaporin
VRCCRTWSNFWRSFQEAANGFGEHSPGNYSLAAAALTELVMTFFFLVVILGATDRRRRSGGFRVSMAREG